MQGGPGMVPFLAVSAISGHADLRVLYNCPTIAISTDRRNTLAGIQFRVNLRDTHSSIESRTASGVSVSGQ